MDHDNVVNQMTQLLFHRRTQLFCYNIRKRKRDFLMYKRVLLKCSGEALSDHGSGFSPAVLEELALQVKEIVASGVQLCIVCGGGNFIRGKTAKEIGIERTTADYMGMLGTVINALAIQGALERQGVETRVQSAIEMKQVAEPYILRRALRHLEKGRVVIFAAGVGSPFFSTDTTAALRASEMKADVILMAKNGTDGIYDKDPNKFADAKRFDTLTYKEVLEKDLQVMDSTATAMCNDNDIDLVVFNMNEKGNILRAIKGETIGTIVKRG